MNGSEEAMRRLDALLSGAAAAPPRFPPNSRYHGLLTLTHTRADGSTLPYVARRFVPPAEALTLARLHSVVQGDRLDLLAAAYLGDPEQWWKIADANGAAAPDSAPETLCDEPGVRLRIALPEGFTGPTGLA